MNTIMFGVSTKEEGITMSGDQYSKSDSMRWMNYLQVLGV